MTKGPKTRRKTVLKGNISQCQSKFILPHTKFQEFNERLSLVESLHKEKLQLSSGPVCVVLCCDNIKSNCQLNKLYLPISRLLLCLFPLQYKNTSMGRGQQTLSERKKETSSLPFVLRHFLKPCCYLRTRNRWTELG